MSLFYVNQTPCFVLGLSQSLELELSSRNKVERDVGAELTDSL